MRKSVPDSNRIFPQGQHLCCSQTVTLWEITIGTVLSRDQIFCGVRATGHRPKHRDACGFDRNAIQLVSIRAEMRSAITISLIPEARSAPFVFRVALAAGCERAA